MYDYHEYEITTGDFRFIGSTYVDEPEKIIFGGVFLKGKMVTLSQIDFTNSLVAEVINYLKEQGIEIMNLRYEEETLLNAL